MRSMYHTSLLSEAALVTADFPARYRDHPRFAQPSTIIRGKGHSKADLPSSPLRKCPARSVKAKIVALGKTNTIFQTSKAFAFAMDVANARIKGDLEIFAARVYAYNNIFCLDSWFLR